MAHPESLARRIACTQREIERLVRRGKGDTRQCQRLREILEMLQQELEDLNG